MHLFLLGLHHLPLKKKKKNFQFLKCLLDFMHCLRSVSFCQDLTLFPRPSVFLLIYSLGKMSPCLSSVFPWISQRNVCLPQVIDICSRTEGPIQIKMGNPRLTTHSQRHYSTACVLGRQSRGPEENHSQTAEQVARQSIGVRNLSVASER